jgi:serine/threonine-protein kinase
MSAAMGHVLHRICPICDVEVPASHVGTKCPTCGTKLVEIRAAHDELIGTVIDERFEIRDMLGKGGMGSVYRAWQRSVGREVAVKLMDRNYSSEPMSVRRFLREARLASQLSQPNTVSVFDFGQADDGRLFIAMELCRGRTLHAVLNAEGRFPPERVVRIATQICDALEAAHGLGIVHRDLKLENVMVLDHPPGRDLVKVLDFGLAKNVREPGSHATESGIVVGTPRYMAPEAAMTGKSGPPADLYALGVMIGELASGKPLWEGDSLPHLVAQKLDPKRAAAIVPEPLRAVVSALIDPEPERRPTAPEARSLMSSSAHEPDAAATVVDATESVGRETIQLRPKRGAAEVATPAATPHVAANTPVHVAQQPQAAAQTPSMSELAIAPPRRRWPFVLILVGAAAAGAGVVAVVTRSGGGAPAAVGKDAGATPVPSTPDPMPVAPAVDAQVALAPQLVVVHVVTWPDRASVVDPDGASHIAPFDLQLAPGKAVKLKTTHTGFRPKLTTVVPEGEHMVVKVLLDAVEQRNARGGPDSIEPPF